MGKAKELAEVETWPISKLRPYKANAPLHPPDQVAQLRKSFQTFGVVWPLLSATA